jgi:hypothetical protein
MQELAVIRIPQPCTGRCATLTLIGCPGIGLAAVIHPPPNEVAGSSHEDEPIR